ncbi:MAG: hypothetical protein IKO58_03435 [Prevotella sp.]|nr:hypothetical protein [Prevotella sp.]MBR4522185.1 hypothetical protein [Prevotella sp.]
MRKVFILFTLYSLFFSFPALAQSERKDSIAPAVTEIADTVSDNIGAEIAQQADSALNAEKPLKELKIKQKRDWTTWKPDPKRALWLALILPGAGQIYNRKYWKLPIVYGGFIGCAYAMRWNNQMYLDYSQAYLDIMDDDPNTASYQQFLHLGNQINSSNIERYKEVFRSRRDRYRRWRDLSFFVMLGVYALSVIDAYVDASLSTFDISDDLSLHVQPAIINNKMTVSPNSPLSNNAIGIRSSLNF